MPSLYPLLTLVYTLFTLFSPSFHPFNPLNFFLPFYTSTFTFVVYTRVFIQSPRCHSVIFSTKNQLFFENIFHFLNFLNISILSLSKAELGGEVVASDVPLAGQRLIAIHPIQPIFLSLFLSQSVSFSLRLHHSACLSLCLSVLLSVCLLSVLSLSLSAIWLKQCKFKTVVVCCKLFCDIVFPWCPCVVLVLWCGSAAFQA